MIMRERPRPPPLAKACANCSSAISLAHADDSSSSPNQPFEPSSCMDFMSWLINRDSNCLAACSIFSGVSFFDDASRPEESRGICGAPMLAMSDKLDDPQFGFQSAGGAQVLQNGDDIARRRANGCKRANQFLDGGAFLEHQVSGFLFLGPDADLRDNFGLALREWAGLRHGVAGLYLKCEIAVHDGYGRDVHVAAHDNGTCALVDDNARGAV